MHSAGHSLIYNPSPGISAALAFSPHTPRLLLLIIITIYGPGIQSSTHTLTTSTYNHHCPSPGIQHCLWHSAHTQTTSTYNHHYIWPLPWHSAASTHTQTTSTYNHHYIWPLPWHSAASTHTQTTLIIHYIWPLPWHSAASTHTQTLLIIITIYGPCPGIQLPLHTP